MPPPALRRPNGFEALATLLGGAAAACVLALLYPDFTHGFAILRAPLLVMGSLLAVAAEALWNCRPWCVRAVASCAVVGSAPLIMIAFVLVAGGIRDGSAGWALGGIAAASPVLLMYGTVHYVATRARRLFAVMP